VGNNRLHILVAMQSGKYQQATVDGREAILDEVIQTVNTFWKGRFLTESAEGYEVINKEDVRNALRSIFDMRSSQNLLSRQRNNGEVPIIPDQALAHSTPKQASIPPPMMVAAGPGLISRNQGFLTQTPNSSFPEESSMGSKNARVGLATEGSSSVISTDPVQLEGVGDLRSAAVRSLQKQKERQTIASRLEKVSTSTASMNLNDNSYNDDHGINISYNAHAPSAASSMDMDTSARSSSSSFASAAKKRQSTVFGKLDPSIMEELTDLDDTD